MDATLTLKKDMEQLTVDLQYSQILRRGPIELFIYPGVIVVHILP